MDCDNGGCKERNYEHSEKIRVVGGRAEIKQIMREELAQKWDEK